MPLDPKWVQTVDDGIKNKAWDEHDSIIQREVTEYNRRFSGSTGFVPLDSRIFKAIIWTESGGPTNAAWKTRPMQIGNTGDPGLTTLKKGLEGSSVIMSDALKRDIQTGNINTPDLNIGAGMAYVLTRLSRTATKSIVDANTSEEEYTVVAGDNLSKIAGRVGSTVPTLTQLNPTAQVLRPGQKIKFRKASMQEVITSWQPITSASLATRYNVGDKDYKAKLDYVMNLLPQLKR